MKKGKAISQPGSYAARASGNLKPGGKPCLVKDIEFSLGKDCNVAIYERSKVALARFVGIQGWIGAGAASLALELGIEPDFVKPTKPEAPRNKYKTNVVKSEGTAEELETNRRYSKDEMWEQNKMYTVKLAVYRLTLRECRASEKARQKNKRSMFNLVLRHCSEELLGKLESDLESGRTSTNGGTCSA